MNLFTALASGFPPDPSARCLALPDGSHVSYGRMVAASAQLANALVDLELKPGDRVAVQAAKSPAFVQLYLACLRAGLVFLPMNPAYQREEVRQVLADASPRLFVCSPDRLSESVQLARDAGVEHVRTLGDQGEGELMRRAAGMASEFPTVERDVEDLAALVYTSGTTGRSKGAMLSHGNLLSNARVLRDYWDFHPDDVLLHALPVFHVHGLFVALHTALLSGSALLFEPRFDVPRALALLPKASVFMGVPTYYTRLLAAPELNTGTCASVRLFVSGSAPLRAETFFEFRARTGHEILERYGMTETGMLTSNPCREADGERRAGTVGHALPGTELRVMRADGTPCEAGEVGEVQAQGPSIMAGYWNRPQCRETDFTSDGFFKTSDLGSLDADGYLTLSGRAKDLVITGGLNVYPKEVEERIDAMEGVEESAVIGIPDPEWGEAVVAVVVRAQGGAHPTEREVVEYLKATLAGYKVPKTVRFVDSLPRNTMGKVQKKLLREALKN